MEVAERNKTIAEQALSGMRTREIAAIYGLKHPSILNILKKEGVMHNQNVKPSRWEHVSDKAIISAFVRLVDINAVAKELKISASYVQDSLNKSWIGES